MSPLVALVGSLLGAAPAELVISGLDLDPVVREAPAAGGWVPRAVLAQALGIVLLADLLERVPSGRAYVEEKWARGETVHLDHGAVRTVGGLACGSLPPGAESVTRVLSALGYRHRETYQLTRLRMTGHSWAQVDLPAAIPQYFVSELHASLFSPDFQIALARVVGSSVDPLGGDAGRLLASLSGAGGLGFDAAAALLPALVACFGRHHDAPSLADYQALLAESEEAAWIAVWGTAFNHATDRVDSVEAVAAAEREAGRPIKDSVEVSASGRILQTAHRAPLVTRPFTVAGRGHDGEIGLAVPGSFFEFITRRPLPDGSGLDLAFDAANAQQIFAMTRGGSRPR